MLRHPFDPIIDQNSKVLVLGSFPSIQSFKNNFYYGHPQNQFWKILAKLFEEEEPKTVEEKKAFLHRHHIALWDMVAGCERETSLDSSLKKIQVNDIAGLLRHYPNIQALFFTGKKAQSLYQRHFGHLNIPTHYLPSPSPAYRSMSLEEKVKKWSILKDFLR